ncbi:MAG: AgmX/PglI C-terminal domain-containing protein [Gallionellaceae bacterium]
MATAHYRSPELAWTASPAEERRFRAITSTMLLLYVLLAALVVFIKVPPADRYEAEIVPPRLAKLVVQEKPKPPPPPPPKLEEKKLQPEPEKKAEEPKPPEPEPEVKKEPARPDVQAARNKASHSGLLALRSEIAGLQQHDLGNLVQDRPLIKADGQNATAGVYRSIIAAEGRKGSGGINTAGLSRDVGQTQLAGRQTTAVQSQTPAAEGTGGGAGAGGGGRHGRSIEEIQLILDRSKGALYTLYHRALRANPALHGKVVLEITIAPSGEVTNCKVVFAELDDPDLIGKLVARIQLLNFGSKDVETTVFTWPIDFLPRS